MITLESWWELMTNHLDAQHSTVNDELTNSIRGLMARSQPPPRAGTHLHASTIHKGSVATVLQVFMPTLNPKP